VFWKALESYKNMQKGIRFFVTDIEIIIFKPIRTRPNDYNK